MKPAVGFIGLGRMGSVICQRLLRHGFRLHVHNRSEGKAAELVQQGAIWAPDLESLTRAVNVLFICTAGEQAVQDIYHACGQGLLWTLGTGSIVIDLSTIAPEVAVAAHAAFRARGVDYIECPVSGGVDGASTGRLSAIVAAQPTAYAAVRPVLTAFCEGVTYVETPGKA